ncbi:MAG: hypothetical protein KIS78_15670 [Labilithrix sp.]|nr:hypothetical protein [Labilithrix sp.]
MYAVEARHAPRSARSSARSPSGWCGLATPRRSSSSRFSTDVDCATVTTNGVSIRLAASAEELALAQVVTESNACGEPGPRGFDLGSIVLIPGASDDVVLEVALGVERPTSECRPPDRVDGCIVARRRVGYVRHRSLRVPIVLARACLGTRCADDETCVGGTCVSAVLDRCSGDDCALERDASAPPPPPLPLDGAVRDATSDGKPLLPDGGRLDAGPCPERPPPPDCGGCPPGQECCFAPAGVACVPSGACPPFRQPSNVCSDACHCGGGLCQCVGPSGSCPVRMCTPANPSQR